MAKPLLSLHEECCHHLQRRKERDVMTDARKKRSNINSSIHIITTALLSVIFSYSFFVSIGSSVVLFVNSFSIYYNYAPTQISKQRKSYYHNEEKKVRLFLSSGDYNLNQNGNSRNDKDRLSKELIEKIKSEADIMSVIESYNIPQFTRLSTDRATALCPFHNDANPSLTIDKKKGLYKCFSCGAGGDVFNFVREYDFLMKHGGNSNTTTYAGTSTGGNQKMPYPAAISKVVKEYCSAEVQNEVGKLLSLSNKPGHRKISPEMKLKIEEENKKKERIVLANSAAADFYAKLLITSPKAGGARSHLFQRSINPSQVRTFALGYAPDAYFSSPRRKTDDWGKGSLVERLEELGFEPKEIVESGLATVTSAAKNRLTSYRSMQINRGQKNTSVANTTKALLVGKKKGEKDEGELRYSDLIDRFRSRLMVPIFDTSGKFVLGFGGRDLNENLRNETEQTYRIPKYLNSPESLVFEKKNLLFGAHRARLALLDDNKNEEGKNIEDQDPQIHPVPTNSKASVLIVEGYFDVISLYGAGICSAVASMGAALTSQQLEIAADLVGRGRIILCLDNDHAGIGAIERICSGSSIWDLVEKRGVEVHIGTLPENVKDPAEFVEMRMKSKSVDAAKCFEAEVLEKAVLWTDWYVDQWISKYDPNDQSSFARVCDVITSFLSNNRNPADRTKQAFTAAGKLATRISGKNKTGPLHIQLESDLLGMAAKKASNKEALEMRVRAVGRLAHSNSKGIRSTEMPVGMNRKIVNGKSDKQIIKGSTNMKTSNNSMMENSQRGRAASNDKQIRNRDVNRRKQSRPLTDHFSGFRFNPSDAAWLGVSKKDSNGDLVLDRETPSWKRKRKPYIYFNSNKYLGYNGGIDTPPKHDDGEMIAAQTNGILVENVDKLQLGAEYRLLRTMIHFSSARLAMKSALANRVDNGPTFEWSSLEREWLFHTLTESPGHEPLPKELQECGTASQLHAYLKARTDVPDGAFAMSRADAGENTSSNLDTNTRFDSTAVDDYIDGRRSTHKVNSERKGFLDIFFVETDDVTNSTLKKHSLSHNERAELTVQESVAILLKASAQKKLSQTKYEWKIASDSLAARRTDGKEPMSEHGSKKYEISHTHDSLSDIELEKLCKSLGDEVLDAIETLRELTESSKQLGRRLLDYCSADGTEGRMSKSKQEELARMLEDHIANLPYDRDKPGYADDYVFGSDQHRHDFDPRYDPKYGGSPINKQPQEQSIFEGDDSLFESIFE